MIAFPAAACAQDSRGPAVRLTAPERGSFSGALVSIRRATPAQPFPLQLSVRTAPGRFEPLLVDEGTQLNIAGSDAGSSRVLSFLEPQVPVEARWDEMIDPSTGGRVGRRVEWLRIRAQWVVGEVVKVEEKGVVVMARPKADPMPEPAEPRGIRVRGREDAPAREPAASDPPPLTRLRLDWVPDATTVTLNGRPVEIGEIGSAPAADGAIRLDALVIPGRRNILVEFHGYSPRDAPNDLADKVSAPGARRRGAEKE